MPIENVLAELLAALKEHRQAVLQAPPGAGKTTRVPLAMLEAGLAEGIAAGRILMLEPRRLATRAAAERMAATLQERVGQTVGYRIKGEARVSPDTRIEVVTEGILTRMIQTDADLPGVAAVIFDEFHERSLQADLGLALCLEIRAALRPDLLLLVMSATLDAAPVAALMGGAPVISAKGRAYPVETRWLEGPWQRAGIRGPRFEASLADLVMQAVDETEGGLLVFLPGEGEIRRTEALLKPHLPADTTLHPLYGAMPFSAQRAAISKTKFGRKLVLATSIAETSLTIEDVRVVIDGGRARRARFDPGSGMSRLITERVTKAEATQRAGRAGRVAPGACYRLWTKGEEGALAPYPAAEIEAADLAPLVLETALWGVTDPAELPFLTAPNPGGVVAAQALLESLEALDKNGSITAHGRQMAALPLHPRLAHMVLRGGADAPLLAAILSERDILSASPRPPAELSLRLTAARDPRTFGSEHPYTINHAALKRLRHEAKRLKPGGDERLSVGELAALAYPDRIGLRRKGGDARYVLSGGKGAVLDEADPLAGARLIVAADLDGDKREARVRLATEISEHQLRALYPERITQENTCRWSKRDRRVLPSSETRFGALVLAQQNWRACPDQEIGRAMTEGIRDLGLAALPFGNPDLRLIARIEWLRARGSELPDFSDVGLMAALEDWLTPHLGACRSAADLKGLDMSALLLARLTWQQRELLDRLAPKAICAPTGTRLPVDYGTEPPKISVRLQEMFGLIRHPAIGPDHIPLLIELLSPAQRPVQTTTDLPGFWASSYADVRKDMRGRYPKHPWPEDPTQAEATRRVKPR